MTPEEAAVAAKREKENTVLVVSLGAAACVGAVLFWGLNLMNSTAAKQARQQRFGERVDWP